MALFKRKQKVDAVGMPAEIQDYYQAENREKTWMAWALGLGTLAVTILIALGLFFGGRWVYRKVRHQPANVATNQNKPAQNPVDTEKDKDNNNESETSSPASSSSTGSSSSSAPATGTSSTSTSTPSSASTPAASSSAIPNTGPADTLAIFLGVTVAAYVVHRRFIAE